MGSADVLISVYAKEKAAFLDVCLHSIVHQTAHPNSIILIKDGPLGDELDAVISRYVGNHAGLFRVIAFEKNQGLITALNRGLEFCECEYVLRMDSDDIAVKDRFKRQIDFMDANPHVGVLSAAMYEFDQKPETARRLKPVLVNHTDIRRQFVFRNPINHPAVCFRTKIIKAAGGYPDLKYLEDYYLWCKLLVAGVQFHNLTEPLQYYRFNLDTMHRRGGWQNLKNECHLRWYLYKNDAANLVTVLFVMLAQLILRLTPNTFREKIWQLSRRSVPSDFHPPEN